MDTLLAAGECWTLDTATLVAAIARHFKTVCALFFTVLHWRTDGVGIGTLTDFYSFFVHLIPFLTVQVTVGWNTRRGSNINPQRHHHLKNLPLHVYLLHIHLISLFFKIQVHQSNEFKYMLIPYILFFGQSCQFY